MRAGLGDAADAALRPAVEDRDVLGVGDAAGGLVEGAEIDVLGAALEVVELGAADVNVARSSTTGSTRRRAAPTFSKSSSPATRPRLVAL